jgi:hypothetical protein
MQTLDWCRLLIFCLLAIISMAWGAENPSTLRGFFFDETIQKHIPGALVVLYSRDQGILVDQTYTMNNGSFTLRVPNTSGWYSIVATKDMRTQRKDVEYDSKQALGIIQVNYKDITEEPSHKVWNYISSNLDILKGFFSGLFLWWFKEWLTYKNKLLEYAKQREKVRKKLIDHWHKVLAALQICGKGTDVDERQNANGKYQENIKDLEQIIKDVYAQHFEASLICSIGNKLRISKLDALDNIIGDIEKLIDIELNQIIFKNFDDKYKQFKDILDRLNKIQLP